MRTSSPRSASVAFLFGFLLATLPLVSLAILTQSPPTVMIAENPTGGSHSVEREPSEPSEPQGRSAHGLGPTCSNSFEDGSTLQRSPGTRAFPC